MLLMLLFISSFMSASDDTIVSLPEPNSLFHEDVAEIMLNDFFRGNGENVRTRLRIVLAERIRNEDENTRRVLIETYERPHGTPSLGSDTSEEVSSKVFELLTDSIEEVILQEEEDTHTWRHEANSRCTKVTVFILSGLVTIAGAAVGAAVTAAIENA